MFSRLKQTVTEKLKNFGGHGDAELLLVQQKCETCTSEYVMQPDWKAIMELCDMINDGEVTTGSERTLRTLARRLAKRNHYVQMLTLLVVEACCKNCGPAFHQQLAFSGFWVDLKALLSPRRLFRYKPNTPEYAPLQSSPYSPLSPRDSSEVNTAAPSPFMDKALSLVEDWSRSLPFPTFVEARDELIRSGIIFPERPDEDKAPWYDASEYARAKEEQQARSLLRTQYQGQSTAAAVTGQTSTALSPTRPMPRQASRNTTSAADEVDPGVLAGLSEADRAAVMSAMEDLDTRAPPIYPTQVTPPMMDATPELNPSSSNEQLAQDLVVAAESVGLLKEILQFMEPGSDAAGEPLAMELVGRCMTMMPRLLRVIERVQDEDILNAALQVHGEGVTVLATHQEKLVGAEQPVTGYPGGQPESPSSPAPLVAERHLLSEPSTPAPNLLDIDTPEPTTVPLSPGSADRQSSEAVKSPNAVDLLASAHPPPLPADDPFAASTAFNYSPSPAGVTVGGTEQPSAAPETTATATRATDFDALVMRHTPTRTEDIDLAQEFDSLMTPAKPNA